MPSIAASRYMQIGTAWRSSAVAHPASISLVIEDTGNCQSHPIPEDHSRSKKNRKGDRCCA
jgi:hypothetical protein